MPFKFYNAQSSFLKNNLKYGLAGVIASVYTPAFSLSFGYSSSMTDTIGSKAITYTGAGHKTMCDHYGLWTYAPNNLLTYSNDFTNAAWGYVTNDPTRTTGISDPDGGSDATTITATGTTSIINHTFTTVVGELYNNSVWIRRRTGTGSIYLRYADNSDRDITSELSGTWTRLNSKKAASGTSSYFAVHIATNGDEVDVYHALSERITHETSPRAYNATTSAAYYGPRLVYNPSTTVTSSTSQAISTTPGALTVASHSFAVNDVVQVTDNADPDNWMRGYVTAQTATTVTLGSYTRPDGRTSAVLTNGSGTISDWTLIRSDGYLPEPAATNLAIYSQDLSAGWTPFNLTSGSAITGPDGVASSALTITADAVTNSHYVYNNAATTTSSATYTISEVVKQGTHRYINVIAVGIANYYVSAVFDVGADNSTATETSEGATAGTHISTEQVSLGNGWYRLSLTFSTTLAYVYPTVGFAEAATGNSFNIYGAPSFTTAGTETFLWFCNQLEAGASTTSYIPTGAAAVARVADVATLTGTDFSDWHTATGTWLMTGRAKAGVSTGRLAAINNGGATHRILPLYRSSVALELNAFLATANVSQLTGFAPYDTMSGVGDFIKVAMGVDTDDFGISLDGDTTVADTSITLPTVNQLQIGHEISSDHWGGTVDEVSFYADTRQANATLEEWST